MRSKTLSFRVREYAAGRRYPPSWRHGVALARMIERLNRIIFPNHQLIIGLVSRDARIAGLAHNTAYYHECNPYGEKPNHGYFLINATRVKADLGEQFVQRYGLTYAQASFWVAAHETRHRVQHLLKPKLFNQGYLRHNPFRRSSRVILPRIKSAAWGRRRFLADLKGMYPGATLRSLRWNFWYRERDAEIAAYLATSVYVKTRSLRRAAAVLHAGTTRLGT